MPHSDDEFKQSIGLPDVYGEKGYTTVERVGIRPTLDVNGIWGGYTGEGAKTVIASKAYAKISMRLVPNQTSEEITALFQKHFASIAPSGVTVKVKPHHGGEPVVTPTDSVAYQAAADAMETTFGKRPIPTRGGGSIPSWPCSRASWASIPCYSVSASIQRRHPLAQRALRRLQLPERHRNHSALLPQLRGCHEGVKLPVR